MFSFVMQSCSPYDDLFHHAVYLEHDRPLRQSAVITRRTLSTRIGIGIEIEVTRRHGHLYYDQS